MSGNFAIKDNTLYGDTALIRCLSAVGYVVTHLGWGDFTCSDSERQFDFFRHSDTNQFESQSGRSHDVRCYVQNERITEYESVISYLESIGATRREFLKAPEEVKSEMRVQLK